MTTELALDRFEALLTAVPADGWERPTPCDKWAIADLVAHVIAVVRLGRELALGADFPQAGEQSREADPVAAWREARRSLEDALAKADFTAEVAAPVGRVPLRTMLDTFFLTEIVAHSWDLATALGVPPALDAELVHRVQEYVRPFGHEGVEGLFEPGVPSSDDADETTRLMNQLGRSA
ncbi:TIGR03086 family metal-binding protein [Amycolatopsis sp. 195334CR]|uniref:TIGR03086 family metal-binding protein n=1 Tax=Amycolatopsis sp. 195334CR TaxID=2814588 RepID=UPI001A8EFC2B|nr:TIGR03086 family metal-binding protein [Amycolatopsis sp. 195334CR]MBN6035064.1 TIGR03086 family protein [Amycolatopsis sp. 195334CR]